MKSSVGHNDDFEQDTLADTKPVKTKEDVGNVFWGAHFKHEPGSCDLNRLETLGENTNIFPFLTCLGAAKPPELYILSSLLDPIQPNTKTY